ncbi:MAG: hypothetical protein PHU98_04340, partial [Mariniphaga sp.]|nr:hypothetical protein [Mariniphaga sp.]
MEIQDERFHEGFFKKTGNKILVGILRLISRLPFRILYLISDILYFFIRYIFRYRRQVVTNNLNYA